MSENSKKRTEKMKKTLVSAIVVSVMWISSPGVIAADYYVDGTNGNDSGLGTINDPWETISQANSTLQAGDTVYIRGGTYNNVQGDEANCIRPTNNGTEGNPITYMAYNNETVIVTGRALYVDPPGIRALILLYNKNYIDITGITVQNPDGYGKWFHLASCLHITFKNCTFNTIASKMDWRASQFDDSDYTQFIDCSWDGSNLDWEQEFDLLVNERSTHYLFLRCFFGKAAHNGYGERPFSWTTDTFGAFIDCTVENTWHSGLGIRGNKILVQGCKFKNGGSETNPYNPTDEGGDPSLYISFEDSICRENTLWKNVDTLLRASGDVEDFAGNWLYHNTFYDAKKYGSTFSWTGSGLFGEAGYGSQHKYNHIINNIIWKAESDTQIFVYAMENNLNPANNTIANNIVGDPLKPSLVRWGNQTGTVQWMEDNHDDWVDGTNSISDPLLVDPDAAVPNFTLQQSSPAIDSARHITLADGSGSDSTGLKCDEVTWAFSGPNPPWNIIHPDIQADRIYFQQSDNSWVERTVVGIDYDTKTITLDTPASWNDNTSVYYKKFNGDAPDIGAYEFTGVACLPIDRTNWSVEFVDSEELVEDGGYPAENSYDGDPDTFWSTEWSSSDPDPCHPHEIQIDLGGFYDICGFRYLPRQDVGAGDENGMINEYKFYVSGDPCDWGSAVVSGTFAGDKTEKTSFVRSQIRKVHSPGSSFGNERRAVDDYGGT
jgi:F5/8 type C domain